MLYGSQQSDADEYADLFDAEATRVLEIHAPLKTRRRRCSGQHDAYVLSNEAVEANRHHRSAERRYRHTGLLSDKRTYKAACNAARTSITTSLADATAASVWRHPSHMAHCAVTAAQKTKGYLRRLGMRGPRRQVQFVLRRLGETHPKQHRVGATAVQPPDVRCTTAYRSRVIVFPAGDYRRGPEAAGVHTTQDIAAGRSACLY